MTNDEMIYLSGAEALAAFKSKTLSPLELMQAIIARIESLNPQINAFTDCYFEQALDQARAAEKAYQSGKARPLEGLSLAVKDEFKLKGTRRTSSSLLYQNRVDDETDVIIERLLNAGAICHAKTTTPEFCLLGSCHSRLWGVTRNPWNLEISPGGSSGGSGAALAAGMTTLATGTDIGGSIRIPSALCGILGYKPPYGRNPEIPIMNLDSYSHSGPMARSVEDLALMQNITSGPHNRDIASLRDRVLLDYSPVKSLKGWKIAFSMDLGFFELDASVRRNTEQSLELFRQLGATVQEVEIDWDESIGAAAQTYWAHGWAVTLGDVIAQRDQLTEYSAWFLDNAPHSSRADYFASMKTTVAMYDRFGPLMDEYDLFICPTLSTSGVPAEFTWPSSNVEVNGKIKTMDEEHWSMTYPFNMLSRCPVMSLPSGLASNGVPSGIQLVARSYDDQRVFSAAMAYQGIFKAPTKQLDPRLFNRGE